MKSGSGPTSNRPRSPSRKLLEKRARREARTAVRQKRGRYELYIYGSIVAVMVLAVIGFVVYSTMAPKERLITTSTGSAEDVGEEVAVQSGTHIKPPERGQYSSDPPTSGQHYSIPGQAPISWGYHGSQASAEYWLHNLEHGGIVILYNCPTGCSEDETSIGYFISNAPKDAQFREVKIVAVGYSIPGHKFALLAWGWRQFMESWDADAAERFYEAHINHGPEPMP